MKNNFCIHKVSNMDESKKTYKGRRNTPPPAIIEYKHLRFIITDRPTDKNIEEFVQLCVNEDVRCVVRVAEAGYAVKLLNECGISVADLPFQDGSPPPPQVVSDWLNLLREGNGTVAVHCVAGLGRGPVLVALALIELGMRYEDAVSLIRKKRRGAINAAQLAYLGKYRSKSRLVVKSRHQQCCLQ